MCGTEGTAQMFVCEANVSDVFGKVRLLMVNEGREAQL